MEQAKNKRPSKTLKWKGSLIFLISQFKFPFLSISVLCVICINLCLAQNWQFLLISSFIVSRLFFCIVRQTMICKLSFIHLASVCSRFFFIEFEFYDPRGCERLNIVALESNTRKLCGYVTSKIHKPSIRTPIRQANPSKPVRPSNQVYSVHYSSFPYCRIEIIAYCIIVVWNSILFLSFNQTDRKLWKVIVGFHNFHCTNQH